MSYDETAAAIVDLQDKLGPALAQVAAALRDLGRDKALDGRSKLRRFRVLCLDLFRSTLAEIETDAPLNAAAQAVAAVEGGLIGRRKISAFIAGNYPLLSAEDRAFAMGLAMGFMTEFLPRGS